MIHPVAAVKVVILIHRGSLPWYWGWWLGFNSDSWRNEFPVVSRSVRDATVIAVVEFGVEAAAIDRDEGGF